MPVLPALPATPVGDGTGPGLPGAGSPADGGFLTALAAALGDAAAAQPGGCLEDEAGSEGKHATLPVGDALPAGEAVDDGPELDPLSLQFQQMAATGVPGAAPLVLSVGAADQVVPGGQLPPGTTQALAPARAAAPAPAPAPAPATVAAPATSGSTLPEPAAQPVLAQPLGTLQPGPAAAAVPAVPSSTDPVPSGPTPNGPTPAAPSTREVATDPSTPAAPAVPAAPQPAPVATGPAPVAPAVVGPAAAVPPAATSQQPGAPAAVVHQVFPEITRLSRAGNGTQRLTVTLQPEHLGEVRVTLVVRDGAVRVSIGSDHATEALIQGAPELRRLLEQAGATDARVVIRDASPAGPDASGAESRGQRDAAGDATHGGDGHDTGAGPRGRSAGRQDSPLDGPTPPTRGATPPDPAMTPGRLDRLM